MARPTRVVRLAMGGLALVVVLVTMLVASPQPTDDNDEVAVPVSTTTTSTTSTSTTTTTTTTTEPPYDGWVDPASSGEPYGESVEGLLTFRGNPTRTYYGQGPVPVNPEVRWQFPDGHCSLIGRGRSARVVRIRLDGSAGDLRTQWPNLGHPRCATAMSTSSISQAATASGPRLETSSRFGAIDPDGYPLSTPEVATTLSGDRIRRRRTSNCGRWQPTRCHRPVEQRLGRGWSRSRRLPLHRWRRPVPSSN